MFTVLSNIRNSNLYLIAALATVIVVLLTIAIAPALSAPQPVVIPVTSRSEIGSDYYQRHPELIVSAAVDRTGDFALRHQEWTISAANAAIPVTGIVVAGPDYFQRHPELRFSVASAMDLTDYFIRHPELRTPNTTIDLSDYFQRH